MSGRGLLGYACAVLGCVALVVSGAAAVSASQGNGAAVSDHRTGPVPLLVSPKVTPRSDSLEASPSLSRAKHGSAFEIVSQRTATSSTWRNPDGSITVDRYLAPRYYKSGGRWQPIDTTLTRDSTDSSVWRSGANAWQVSFGPAGASGGSEVFATAGTTVGFNADGSAGGVAPVVSGSTATYKGLWPDTTLTDTVASSEVDEQLILGSAAAPASFAFTVSGAEVRANAHQGLDVVAGGKTLGVIPAPLVTTADDHDVTKASGAVLTGSGTQIDVAVSGSWLGSLPASAFPVVIDPTFQPSQGYVAPSAVKAYSSHGATSSEVTFGANTQGTWASTVEVPLPTPPAPQDNQPWQLGQAAMWLACQSKCTLTNTQASAESSQPTSYAAVLAGPSAPGASVDTAFDSSYLDGRMWVYLADNPNYAAGSLPWVSLIATSSSLVQIPMSAIVFGYTYYELPPPGAVTAPADGSVIAATTPTLTTAITDPNLCPSQPPPTGSTCDTQVDYRFQISTSPAGDPSEVVADSGWFPGPFTTDQNGNVTYGTPAWTVPPGSLSDGVKYYASVQSTNDTNVLYGIDGKLGNIYLPPPTGPVSEFQVKLRLSAGGPSPTDTIGAPPGQTSTPSAGSPSPGTSPSSETVNMVTGNLALDVGTPAMQTLSGAAAVQLAYNSSQSSTLTSSANGSSSYGLLGQYYPDDGTHTFPATGNPAGQRIDPTVNLQDAYQPISALTMDTAYLVRWTGQITLSGAGLPAGTVFQVGAATTGGIRVKLNGSTVYDDWSGTATPSGAIGFASQTFAPGTSDQIEVDDWDPNTPGSPTAQLWLNEIFPTGSVPSHAQIVVPSSWLQVSLTGLPPGWVLSSTAAPEWSSVSDAGSQVVVHAVTGATATFTNTGHGSYQPPDGDTDSLSSNGGHLQLSTSDGYTYVFNTDGSLASVTSASNDLHPDALVYGYAQVSPGSPGSPIVLESITDPVSNRVITLSYSGEQLNGSDVTCPSVSGGATPPTGMLCQVSFPDGTTTNLYYNSNGELAEVLNPGGSTTLFGYDADNRLDDIRDALANDYVTVGQPGSSQCGVGSTNCPFDTQISYDGAGRVASVTQPAPTYGAARPGRTYSYTNSAGGGTTDVAISGFDPFYRSTLPDGEASAVSYDAQSRVTTQTNSAGLISYTVWDSDDRPIISVDTTGEQTSQVYDVAGDITDTYGPAPEACFTAGSSNPWPSDTAYSSPPAPIQGYLPVADPTHTNGCDTAVPHAHASYDDGITGLAATYWPNATYAGAPSLHGTGNGIAGTPGFGCAGGSGTSSTALCASWPAGSAPGGTDSSGNWSMRLSGLINIASTGAYQFTGTDTQAMTLRIDGQPVGTNINYARDGSVSSIAGQFTAAATLTAGAHTIELDIQGSTTTTTSYTLAAGVSGGSSAAIPLSQLDPSYRLKTTSTDADGLTTTTSYTAGNLGAQYGLPTATTAGAGSPAATTTSTTYETPGSGWLRKLSTTLPAGNTTNYQYYGGSETLTTTTCGVGTTVPQDGLLKAEIDPAPSPSTSARERQFVYDAMGRQVGLRVGPASNIASVPWQCTSLDPRGRITSQSWPAVGSAPARTVTYTYSVGGNPLTSSVSDTSDPNGTIQSTVDLLGRVVSYTDALQKTTTTSYDQAGQVTQTNGPNGLITNGYDPNSGRLITVDSGGVRLAGADYNSVGQLATVTYSNGTTGTISYDPNGRQTGLVFTNSATGALVTGDQVTDSPAGRITTELENINGSLTNPNPAGSNAVDYTYDGAGRLVSANLPGGVATYSYANNPGSDACADPGQGQNTNRTSVTFTPASGSATRTDYCYNTFDQLTSSVAGAGGANPSTSTDYGYDGHGNQTRDNGTALSYDAADRLSSTTNKSNVTSSYAYDAVDRIISRTTSGGTTSYVYGGFTDQPAATVDPTGKLLQLVTLPGGVTDAIQPSGPNPDGSLYVPLEPTRIADTRPGSGYPYGGQTLGPGDTLNVLVDGQGNVPTSGVTAVVLNVTEATDTSSTTITVWPTGTQRPLGTTVHATAGANSNSQTTVAAIGTGGQVSVYNSAGNTDIVIDVEGYYTDTGNGFNPLPETRIADSRAGSGLPNAGQTLPAGGTDTVQVTGMANIPGNATAAVVELTALNEASAGYLETYPAGIAQPVASTIHYLANTLVTKEATIELGNNGQFTIYSSAKSDFIVDVVGYYTPGTGGNTMTVDSTRLLDTRSGSGQPYAGQPIPAGGKLTVQAAGTSGVPTNATALIIDLVVPDSTASGTTIYAYPSDAPQPLGASLRFVGPVAFNEFTIKLSSSGAFTLYNTYGTTDVVVDILGYYTPESGGIWSYPDLHGNDTVTTDNNGTQLGSTALYDPWGSPLSSPVSPPNASVTSSFSSYGGDGKISDQSSGITIMGARALNTTEGRFMSVDPIYGGCANAYVYAYGDPFTQQDLTGQSGCANANEVGTYGGGLGSAVLGAVAAGLPEEAAGEGLVVGGAALISGLGSAISDAKACLAGHWEDCGGALLGTGGSLAGGGSFLRNGLGTALTGAAANLGIGGFVSDLVGGIKSVVCGIGHLVTSGYNKLASLVHIRFW